MNLPSDQDRVPGALSISVTWAQGCARVSVVGDLDVTGTECLTDWARKLTAEPVAAVSLDISGVGFADAAGFRALTLACELLRRRSGSFRLTGMPASLSRIAGLVGLALPGQLAAGDAAA